MMEFTKEEYINMINNLKKNHYKFANYINYREFTKPVIFRHDVDFSLEKALEMAKLEKEYDVKSIYFVLLTSDFYNIFSRNSIEILEGILENGHEIGLHFDEKRYEIRTEDDLKKYINNELKIMNLILNKNSIDYVSMHRPSKWILENKFEIENVINTYTEEFMNKFKYVSDSRMNWRENPFEVINSGSHNKLHILTHPFWYSNNSETRKSKIEEFIYSSKNRCEKILNENITDLNKILESE